MFLTIILNLWYTFYHHQKFWDFPRPLFLEGTANDMDRGSRTDGVGGGSVVAVSSLLKDCDFAGCNSAMEVAAIGVDRGIGFALEVPVVSVDRD